MPSSRKPPRVILDRDEAFPVDDQAVIPDDVAKLLSRRLGGDWQWWWRASPPDGIMEGAAVLAQLKPANSGRKVLTGVLLLGDAITAEDLRKVPVIEIENSANLTRQDVARDKLAQLAPLKRTRDMSPEDFARLVAEHYRLWAEVVPHPAAAMAAEHGVKDPTMHSWIREARLRGFLPAARRGKR